jgi:hypothetical protein
LKTAAAERRADAKRSLRRLLLLFRNVTNPAFGMVV